jgi:hypothetical protein
MSITLYDVTIPVLCAALTNLSAILDKGIAHAAEKQFDAKALADSRLIADMHPLARQVQIACDTAKGAAARLAGIDAPKHEDIESTLPELQARIAKTLNFIQTIQPQQINGAEAREIVMVLPALTLKFTGHTYVTTFVLPNFFFHVTTVYALLRQNGVALSKRDYLGKIQ